MFEKIKRYINLENYFLLVIFLLPAYLLRFNLFGIPENVWEIMAISAVVLAILKSGKNIKRDGYEKKISILFLIIVLGLALGMMKSGNYRVGLGIIKSWFFVPFVFAVLASKIIKDKKMAYCSLFLSTMSVAIIALIYKILGMVTYDGRLQAFFNSPNYLAMYLALGMIIGAVLLGINQDAKLKMQNHNSKLKILFLLSFLAIFVSLYFSYSYAAWVSVAVALIIVFSLTNGLSKKYSIILVLIFLALVLVVKDTAKFQDLVNYNSRSSLASRVMIWQSAGKIIKDNHILGIGPGNFQEKYLEYQKYFPPYLEWAVPHPHNLFLAFWLNCGIFGLLAFLGILYLFFINVETRPNVETRQCLVSTIAAGIIIYFLLHGLVDTTILKNDLAVVFWLAIFI